MSVVLGIDAAWTRHNPSGVALAARRDGRWRLLRSASSFAGFLEGREEDRPSGGEAPVGDLLNTARGLAGEPVSLVAVDMPMATGRILKRRVSDNAISSRFGREGCGTHSPSETRPGPVSCQMRDGFAEHQFHLRTSRQVGESSLIEVYPHPALLALCGAEKRLPYKYGKKRDYWPRHSSECRTARLKSVWRKIVCALNGEIDGVAAAFPLPEPEWGTIGRTFKAFEDRLDAVVCVWVGACALEGRAEPNGDEVSAIWVPSETTAA